MSALRWKYGLMSALCMVLALIAMNLKGVGGYTVALVALVIGALSFERATTWKR